MLKFYNHAFQTQFDSRRGTITQMSLKFNNTGDVIELVPFTLHELRQHFIVKT